MLVVVIVQNFILKLKLLSQIYLSKADFVFYELYVTPQNNKNGLGTTIPSRTHDETCVWKTK
jgi:hypothetical protein